MAQYKTSSELKDLAKSKLNGKYGSCMLTLIMPALLAMGFLMPFYFFFIIIAVIISLSSGGTVNELTVSAIVYPVIIVCSIGIAMFNAGISLFYLNITCGRRYKLSDIFFGFRWQFKKTFLLAAATTMVSIIPMLPYQVFSTLYNNNFQTKWLIGMIISYICGMAIYIPISLMLSQSFYLLLDFPQYSTKQILQLSIKVMRGNKWRLFCLNLSFIPMELLGTITCGIGYLWISPYMQATRAMFFLDLMNPRTSTASPISDSTSSLNESVMQ